MPVVGRSRWLRIPYRNTHEIYQAAYEVIRTDDVLKTAIENETGLLIEPDMDTLRHGQQPRLYRFEKLEAEAEFIKTEINRLHQLGYEDDDMVILTRRKNGIKRIRNYLRNIGVEIETFHALKGLEYEVVFLSQMQDAYTTIENEEDLSQENRLVYMAMTRARNNLYLFFEGTWPKQLNVLIKYVNRV